MGPTETRWTGTLRRALLTAVAGEYRGEGAGLTGFVTSAPELFVGGKSARRTRLVALAPELSVGGEGALRTGLVALAPELSVGGEERVGRDWLRRPWNYPSGDQVGCVCGGWQVRRLWIRSPRVTLRCPRNYPSGPTEMRWTGTLRRALLTAVAGEYNYRLLRRDLPEVRDLLCAIPRNNPSREARDGKVLGRTPTFRLGSIK